MSIVIPNWWIIVSGILFSLSLIATIVLLILAIQLLRTVTSLAPKITSITTKVQRISTSVHQLTTDVKVVAGHLTERSAPIAVATRDIAATATSSFAKFAPLIALVTGAINMLEARNTAKEN